MGGKLLRRKKAAGLLGAVALLLALSLLFGACGKKQNNDYRPPAAPQGEESGAETTGGGTVMVAVFSVTGTTKGVAERIAALTGGSLAEIVPAEPYAADDCVYNDQTCRAAIEQHGAGTRPAIAGEISLAGCGTLYLGYPIWWGEAPRIMSTFVESHDFSGVTVIPFCTSFASDIGSSDDALAALAGSGNWLQGKRFSGEESEEQMRAWLAEMGQEIMDGTLHLQIGETEIAVTWEENASVRALIELVRTEPLTIPLSMYGGFEQTGPLGRSLPQNDRTIIAEVGDVMLYAGDRISLFYGSNEWAYTRLGKMEEKTAEELEALLGNGDVTITLRYGGETQ